VDGSIMPPSNATEMQIWALTAYLKSLGATALPDDMPGDPKRGERLFAARCASCHRIQGQGGTLGPELSRIGALRTLDDLRRSIREPGASVARGYRPVRLQTATGKLVRGALKNEDAFSLQLMDTRERLRGYRKSDLRWFVHDSGSLMPAYPPGRIDESGMDDLLHYLGTRRGQVSPERGQE
jgi:putative heme-binding domain-containing protein